MSFLLLASGLALGQTSAPAAGPDDQNSVASELKALREAIAAQQKQIAEQQAQIEKLQKQSAASTDSSSSPRLLDANLKVAGPTTVYTYAQDKGDKESPLSFRIGAAEFTPGGFIDFENVFRSTNTGNVTATNFWAIPYSNTVGGHLTEYRSTGQYSRFSLNTHAKFGENDISGYLEFDFNGNDAVNVFVTSNPHTDRIRLYFMDLKRHKWEFLGGQVWGLQTPNRVGVGSWPSDLALTYGEDAQVHVGVNYTRAAAFRAAYHFNDQWVWAAEIQNPQQFGGQGAEVIFPAAFNAALSVQVDQANNAGAPNVAPDFLTKVAFDKNVMGGRHFHWEGGALMTTAKVTVVPTTAGATFTSHSTVGGGMMTAMNFELWKGADNRNFAFVGNGMWGYGIGRYLIGMGPQFVVAPVNASGATCAIVAGSAVGCDVKTSGVHAGDMTLGFEARPHPKTQLGIYYGGAYFQRNFFPDITSTAVVKPFIGFGGPNSNNANNRAIQEGTFDWTQTFWKNPQYGALLLVTQFSYVTRSPWFVPLGAPKNAHLGMGYVSLRYVLP